MTCGSIFAIQSCSNGLLPFGESAITNAGAVSVPSSSTMPSLLNPARAVSPESSYISSRREATVWRTAALCRCSSVKAGVPSACKRTTEASVKPTPTVVILCPSSSRSLAVTWWLSKPGTPPLGSILSKPKLNRSNISACRSRRSSTDSLGFVTIKIQYHCYTTMSIMVH